MDTKINEKIQWALDTFNNNGIEAHLENDFIVISKYCQPKGKTFSELGIDEDELIENVGACVGCFDLRKSNLKTFPLIAAREIKMYEDNLVKEMPNLKLVGILVCNSSLKRVPKLKKAISISMENSSIKSFPKLKEADVIVAQNSKLESLPALKGAKKICIVDCPFEDLSELQVAQDVFICSCDEENKLKLYSLDNLEKVDKLFVVNSELKTLPKLKEASKIALYNSKIKSIKKSIKAEVEIQDKIADEQLSEKFDTFTDWYNSDLLEKSMNLLGDIVKKIKK